MSANAALRPEPLTEAERLAEEIAETHLNQPENSGNTADRYQAVVHANRESATLESGPHVSSSSGQETATQKHNIFLDRCICTGRGLKKTTAIRQSCRSNSRFRGNASHCPPFFAYPPATRSAAVFRLLVFFPSEL